MPGKVGGRNWGAKEEWEEGDGVCGEEEEEEGGIRADVIQMSYLNV